ncbi:MAG: hypothetical protein ACYDA1_09500 [Vulcanimicrobiaceae bacterium]
MSKQHKKNHDHQKNDDKNAIREAIMSADATGMIAGEELITEAETMLPTTAHGTKK